MKSETVDCVTGMTTTTTASSSSSQASGHHMWEKTQRTWWESHSLPPPPWMESPSAPAAALGKHRGRKKSYKRFSESWEFYIWHIQDGEAFQITLSPLVALGKGCSSQLPWQLFSWHLLIVWLIKSKAQVDSKPKHTQFTVKCVQGKQKSSHLRVKAANNCLSLTSTNTFAVMDRNSLK